jgi:hypothetical protein
LAIASDISIQFDGIASDNFNTSPNGDSSIWDFGDSNNSTETNPATNSFYIDLDNSVKLEELQISDLTGRILSTYNNPVPGQFSIVGIASATYFIQCFGGAIFASKKLVVIQ